ncbi:MAG TPA: MHYT domain-containing protein [Stellaceae bacterium]|nr:MHYT domain-containing protein [Stellaceae bacterium]
MFQIYSCITEQHDLRLVVLAALIGLIGCHTALSLTARAHRTSGKVSWFGVSAAALVAGSGVWATHFVAMLAFQPGFSVGYDIGLTAVSIALSIGMVWVSFVVAFRAGAPLRGGALFGIAVGAMHFTGMVALSVPARLHWDPSLTLASLGIGVVFGGLALRVHARDADLRDRIGAAFLLIVAIAGLHFTAMAAVRFELDPLIAPSDLLIAPERLAIAIAVVMMMIVMLGLSGSIVDQRRAERATLEAARLRAYVAELEATKRDLQATSKDLEMALEAVASTSQVKSQFLATMSHELRTPLNAIIGFSEILANGLFGPLGDQRYTGYAADILRSGHHLLGLINDILDFSKIDTGHLELEDEEVDLNALVDEAIRMIAGQAAKAGVTMSGEVDQNLPIVRADSRRLRQILLNLLSNAVKFTPAGGVAIVTAYRCEAGIALTVADTGIGIAAEDIPMALERFGQVDSELNRKYEGTGLGLPLSKRLVELHGGGLSIASTVGQGTAVTITLPAERLLPDLRAA